MKREKKSSFKVLLINPPQPREDLGSNFGKATGFILPYNLLSIASFLNENGIECNIMDCVAERKLSKDVIEYIKENGINMIGLTSFTFSAPQAFKIAQKIKEEMPGIITVMGGIHATVLPKETMMECASLDYIVAGEGEETLLELINFIRNNKTDKLDKVQNLVFKRNNKVIINKWERSLVDVERIPIPDYSLLNLNLYKPHAGNYKVLPTYTFFASRGCPFNCSFCSANIILGRRVRYKPIDKAIEEVKILKEKYGAKGLLLQDSTFTLKRKWVVEFCERLIKEKIKIMWRANTRVDCIDEELIDLLKKAGFYRLNCGFESGNQKTLDLLSKETTVEQNLKAASIIKKKGLELGASFIIGLPGEDINDVMNTINFAQKIGGRYVQFYLPVPFPGTKLREICAEGVRKNAAWHDYNSRDFTNAVYINNNFSEEFFKNLPDYAYNKYYSNLSAVFRILISIKSFDELKNVFFILKKIFLKKRSNKKDKQV